MSGCDLWRFVSIAAELLVGAHALSLADRHHFELNLSDLLNKSTQHKKNWLLCSTFWHSGKGRCERQQATHDGIQTLSAASSKLIKWMTMGRASQCAPSTSSLPMPPPSFWAHLSPLSPGIKDVFLQLKMPFAIKSEWSSSLLALPHSASLAQNLQ